MPITREGDKVLLLIGKLPLAEKVALVGHFPQHSPCLSPERDRTASPLSRSSSIQPPQEECAHHMQKEGFFSITSPFHSTKFKEKEKTAQVRIICPNTRHLAISGVCGPSSLRICTPWRSVAMATWPLIIIGPSGCPRRERRTCPTKTSRTWYLCYHLPGWDVEG